MKLDVLCIGEPLLEFNQIPDDVKNTYRSGFVGETLPIQLLQLLARGRLRGF